VQNAKKKVFLWRKKEKAVKKAEKGQNYAY
jgi:hypothetical protein